MYPEYLNKRYFKPVLGVDPVAGLQRSLLMKKGISRDECGVTAGRRPAIIKRDVLLLRLVPKGICFQTEKSALEVRYFVKYFVPI